MIGRRDVLGGLAAMSFPGGNPPMRADQAVNLARSRAGSGPAPQSAFVVARRVIVFGTNGGIFVYSGQPGFGTLLESSSPIGGTDPYGNVYFQGFAVYGINNAPLQAVNINAVGWVVWNTAATEAGPWVPQCRIRMGAANNLEMAAGLAGPPQTTLQVQTAGGATLTAGPLVSTGGTNAAASLIATDTEHAFIFANGWTQAAGRSACQRFLCAAPGASQGSVLVMGAVVIPAGGPVLGQPIIVAAGAAYRPNNPQPLIGIDTTIGVMAELTWTAGGVLQYTQGISGAPGAGDILEIPPQLVYLAN